MTEPPLVWTAAQTAGELGISKAHLYRLVRENKVPFVRVGRLVRFQPDDVRSWLDERTVPAAGR